LAAGAAALSLDQPAAPIARPRSTSPVEHDHWL
jgi:hypothetical protein